MTHMRGAIFTLGIAIVAIVATHGLGCTRTGSGETESAARVVGGNGIYRPVNDLPTPYQRIEPWGELPEGTTAWAAVTGAEPGPHGNIYVLHRCFENSCDGRPEAPILKMDPSGSLLASWGAGMFVWPHGFHVDDAGNVWVTDARASEPGATRSSSSARMVIC